MKPLVSIVVPVYNVKDYVFKCLESLVGQSYEQIEIIVVDDGSTDESGEICDEFAHNERKVKVFHKKNGGLSSARNYGIKKAKGEYVCLVDSDDWVKKDFVTEMMEVAGKEDADVVVCGYNDLAPEQKVLSGEKATVKLLIGQENMEIIAWNKMYRRILFNEVLYPEGENYEDTLTTYKLLSKAEKVAYVAKSLYVYRERAGSIMEEGKKEEKLVAREKAAREAMGYFKNDSDLEEASWIAMLTAKLAWVDFSISGKVKKKYLNEGMNWVRKNKEKLIHNKYLNKKLRLYIILVTSFGGKLYVGLRKVRHE